MAAVSVAMLWIGWVGEWRALPAGSLNVLVIAVTTTVYFFYLSANGRPELIPYAIAGILSSIASAAAFLSSQKFQLRDDRSTPRLVRISFGIFIVTLALTDGALVLRIPIFRWELNPDSSVIFGCIFLGDAFYFLNSPLKPRWYNALGQLLSFLAYDIILIVPFLKLFRTIQPEHLLSLITYTAVLVYSGAISIYFLFVDKQTRTWFAAPNAAKANS